MQNIRTLGARKNIVLIAHDHKKRDLEEWVGANIAVLSRHELYATGTTARRIELATNIRVTPLMSGPLGGDQQVGSMIAQGHIDIMIFFSDPMEALVHDSDVKALVRLAAVWNIPFACDRSSADFLVTSSYFNSSYDIQVPDDSHYLNRKIEVL